MPPRPSSQTSRRRTGSRLHPAANDRSPSPRRPPRGAPDEVASASAFATNAHPPVQAHPARPNAAEKEGITDGWGVQRGAVNPSPVQNGRSLRAWVRRCRQTKLVSIHEVDVFLRFNQYIRRGYRPSRLTRAEALGSIVLYFHNESMNILIHLFFAGVFLLLFLYPPIPPLFAGLYDVVDTTAVTSIDGARDSPGSPDVAADLWGSDPRTGPCSSSPTTDVDDHALCASHEPAGPLDPTAGVAGSRASVLLRHDARASSGAVRAVLLDLPRGLVRRAMGVFDLFPGSAPRARARGDVDGGYPTEELMDPVQAVLRPLSFSLATTFLLSCVYHTFMPCCATQLGYQQLIQCDVFGVIITISGSAYVYLVRGNPCASPGVVAALTVVMIVSSVCTLYALILAPFGVSMGGFTAAVMGGVADAGAALVLTCLELLRGGGVSPPPPYAEDDIVGALHRRRRRFARRLRGLRQWLTDPTGGSSRETCRCPACDPARTTAAAEERVGPGAGEGCSDGCRGAREVARPTLSAQRRGAIALVHCLVHLLCYVLIIAPKRSATGLGVLHFLSVDGSRSDGGGAGRAVGGPPPTALGYTQSVYYHGLAYLWLFGGGLLNVSRQPERLLWAATRRARAYEQRSLERAGAAAVAAAEQARRQDECDSAREVGGALDDLGEGRRAAAAAVRRGQRVQERQHQYHPQSSLLSQADSESGKAVDAASAARRQAEGGEGLTGFLLGGLLHLWPGDMTIAELVEEVCVWWPAAGCYYCTRYVLSNRELDFVGNSHNLWHVMTGLSAMCMMIGTYYDIVEWELMSGQC